MIKEYYNYGTVVGQIKELLSSFNMPLVPVYIDENLTPAIKGRFYIKDECIVKFTGSDFEFISSYNYGKEILNLTKRFLINSSEYDQYTHKYLGDYLRFVRDYHKVNLMSMYNCFFSEQPIAINKSVKLSPTESFRIYTSDPLYTYYIVKAKFNREYTIAIDCNKPYEIASILYDVNIIEHDDEELINKTYTKVNGSLFKRPYVFSKLCDKELTSKYWDKERDLRILLKLPKGVDSSIVILEGNFKDAENVVSGVYVNNFITSDHKDTKFFRESFKLSLLDYNNKISYPFSNRLIEYLFGQAITPMDDISSNIERVQDMLYDDIVKGYYGMYTDQTRADIYNQMMKRDITQGTILKNGKRITKPVDSNTIIIDNSIIKKYKLRFIDNYKDLTGYVDKDVETMLSLGVSKQDE